MKHASLLLLAVLLSACGSDDSKPNAAPSPITGLDGTAEYNRVEGHLSQANQLPRAGETKTIVHNFRSEESGPGCRYTSTHTYQISNVAADSFDESHDAAYTLVSGSNCPAIPVGDSAGHTVTHRTNEEYVALKRADLRAAFDLKARMARQSWISKIGIESSQPDTVMISGLNYAVQRVTLSITDTKGVTFQEIHDYALDSWFLGEVNDTSVENGRTYVNKQVTSYNP